MVVKVEKKDKNIVELEIEVEAAKFERRCKNLILRIPRNLPFRGSERVRPPGASLKDITEKKFL